MEDASLRLLLADADDGRETLQGGLPLESAADEPSPDENRPPGAANFYDFSEDPNLLPSQRWGILAPEGPEGDRLLEIVQPLLRQRQADQEGAPVHIYRAPAGLDERAAWKWKDTHYRKEGVPTTELPRYLMVLGDLDRVSFALQSVMASDLFVGRLVCPSHDGYDAYVKKVLRWERGEQAGDPRALFFTAKDGTAATTIGHKALVAPSMKKAHERSLEKKESKRFQSSSVEEIPYEGPEDAKDTFLEAMAGAGASMLFTMSHGAGAPRGGWRSRDEQLAMQGAICLGSGVKITAEEVASVPFLAGGIWFFLACYGGGTPDKSAYYDWLLRLKEAGGFGGRADSVLAGLPKPGEAPFIAALPKAVLANPNGPLSVMAHLDLAWTYSFQDIGGPDRSSRFEDIFRTVVAGKRAAVSHNQLLRFMGEASIHLTSIYAEEASTEGADATAPKDPARVKEKANLWMLRQDLAGYMLLGDPAARLPVRRNAPPQVDPVPEVTSAPAEAAPPNAATKEAAPADFSGAVEPPGSQPPAEDPGPSPEPSDSPDVSAAEDAVLFVLGALDRAERRAAKRHGVSREQLRRWIAAYQAGGRHALGRKP